MNDLNFYETESEKGLEYIKEAVDSGATVPLTVTGSSMMPLLKPQRDIVWLERCGDDDIKKGAILLFERAGGKPVLHRVVNIKNGRLVMNGDALSWSETIDKAQVVACVKRIERNGKTVSCEDKAVKVRDALWYVTRPIRPVLKKLHNLTGKRKKQNGKI